MRLRGQGTVEYALILALVALVVLVVLFLLGDNLRAYYDSIAGGMGR